MTRRSKGLDECQQLRIAEMSNRTRRAGGLHTALISLLLTVGLFAGAVCAADRLRTFRIGALTTAWGSTPMISGLRDGLLALDYREGEDFVLGIRFTQGDYTALPEAARKLVQYDVDLIFVGRALAAKAAQQATKEIPIVFAGVSDPVGAGLIDSFARSGGNTTGVSDLGLDLGPKRLEIFREMIPSLRRVLFPYEATNPDHKAEAKSFRAAAPPLGIELMERPLKNEGEAKILFARLRKGRVDGILAPRCCFLNLPGLILEVAERNSLPTMFGQAFWVERGALASYGPDYYTSGRQAARLVDKIFKGTKTVEIPVETNSKIEFTINWKVAKTRGLTIPPEVLYRAQKLIR